MLIPVILSGGAGTRLWPVSREGHPKPFMMLPDGETLQVISKRYQGGAGSNALAALRPGDPIEVVSAQGTTTFTVLGVRRDGDPLPQPLAEYKGLVRYRQTTLDWLARHDAGQPLLAAGRNLGLLGLDMLPPAKRWFARQAMGLGPRSV